MEKRVNGMKGRNKAGERGFTLIELMIVIVILAILATIVVPRFMGREEQAKRTAAIVQIKNFEGALKLFKLDNGFYPSTEQGLKALIEQPTTGRIPKNWKEGGYLEAKEVPLDPWGNSYVYLSPGVHNKEYDIVSYGADGVEGGEGNDADIQSWALER
jgi:general secretion pathway protein G